MPSDHYRTLASPAEFRHKIERSEFLGIAFPVTAEEQFFEELHRIEKRYFDATHHCWAFRLFNRGETRQRSSDAGEPSGTAGKPILAALEGADVHDAAVVVVRWYGGVKLGTGGLARAYRDTAVQTLNAATLLDRFVYTSYEVIVPYDMLSVAYRLVAPPDIVLHGEKFEEQNVFSFDVRLSAAHGFERTLTEKRLQFIPRQP